MQCKKIKMYLYYLIVISNFNSVDNNEMYYNIDNRLLQSLINQQIEFLIQIYQRFGQYCNHMHA